jgi:hypothetical protein
MILIIITCFILYIAFNAIEDGFYYKMKNSNIEEDIIRYGILHHSANVSMMIIFTIAIGVAYLMSIWDIALLFISFSMIRFGLFDMIFNKTISKPFYYMGTTSVVDILLGRIFKTADGRTILGVLKFFALMIGLAIMIHYVRW